MTTKVPTRARARSGRQEKNPTNALPTEEKPLAAEAAALRALAQDLLDRYGHEEIGYEKFAFLATLIDDDNPHVAIRAHHLVVEYVVKLVQEIGLVEDQCVQLLNALSSFISRKEFGFVFYTNGHWFSSLDEFNATRRRQPSLVKGDKI